MSEWENAFLRNKNAFNVEIYIASITLLVQSDENRRGQEKRARKIISCKFDIYGFRLVCQKYMAC